MSDQLSPKKSKSPLLIAIAGAKGGVGKSMVCSNLAVQFAQANLKTLLVDLDLGAANQHTLLGLSRSALSWTDWLIDPKLSLEHLESSTQQKNLTVLAASGYRPGVAEINSEHQALLLEQLKELDKDVILLDLGAGSYRSTLHFFAASDIKVLVTTTESTSLLNNFEFLKNVLYQSFCKVAQSYPEALEEIHKYKANTHLKLDDLIENLEQIDPFFALNMNQICELLQVNVIFNQVRKIEEVHHAVRLKKIVQKQLHLDLEYPGFIFFSEKVVASMQKHLPISYIDPQSVITKTFHQITAGLLKSSLSDQKPSKSSFSWHQIKDDFHKNRVERKKAHHLL